MIKDVLKASQPVVYQALENACRDHRISSAYLFTGPYGTPKYEAAILLAQSILCEKQDGLACEECNTCRRVREGLYADLIVLDGRKDAISKEMIDGIQEKFSKTALEANGQRVYIIRNAENASVAAQNSMLKFLEEPGKGVTAILTTDSVNRILPTIISRCTSLPFVPVSAETYYAQALAQGIPEEDAYFISHIVRDPADLADMYDVEEQKPTKMYEHAVGMLKQYLNAEGLRRKEISTDFEVSWSSQASDASRAKKENLITFPAFFDLLILYAHDVIRHDAGGPAWYHDAVMHAKGKPADYTGLIRIAAEEKDLCNRYNDLYLVMYQTFFRLEEYNHERDL